MSPILLKIFVEAVAGTFKVQDYASLKIEITNGSVKTREYEFKVLAAATEEAEKEEDSAGNQDEN